MYQSLPEKYDIQISTLDRIQQKRQIIIIYYLFFFFERQITISQYIQQISLTCPKQDLTHNHLVRELLTQQWGTIQYCLIMQYYRNTMHKD